MQLILLKTDKKRERLQRLIKCEDDIEAINKFIEREINIL